MRSSNAYKAIFQAQKIEELFEERISTSSAVGRDGIRVEKFEQNLKEEICNIITKVDSKTYRFTGYKEKLILKGHDKPPRQISIPTVRDRLTLRALCEVLHIVFSDLKTKQPHQYIKSIKEIISTIDNSYCFLRIDVKNYYPSVNHDILLSRVRSRIRLPQTIDLVNRSIKTPTNRQNKREFENERGIPQGLSISNILSTIYLERFDIRWSNKYHFFRYVDDIIFILPKSEANNVYLNIKDDLKKLGLECHDISDNKNSKSKIDDIISGTEYLGYKISKNKISVRESSYKKMFDNILREFTLYKYKKDYTKLIWKLNLKITGCIYNGNRMGWVFFFSQTDDLKQLGRLDKFVKNLIKEFNVENKQNNIKRFIKSYYEIRYNMDKTKYIPVFDNYDEEQKISVICMTKKALTPEAVSSWSSDQIDREFKKIISKEVSKMEKDVLEVFS